ncbi:MAG: hypothetical protein KF729_14670 [Sandaracinaceae bacterium]|nr:hypothetical protein [Sandaracinaceae bacterium]
MERALGRVGVFVAVLLAAALAPVRAAEAGACARFGLAGLALVEPGGPIALGPEAGPLVEHVVTGRTRERSRVAADPLRALRVLGPGELAVRPRAIAPGVHRLEGPYRAGTYRVSGLARGGRVRFVRGEPVALPPPALASAHLAVVELPASPGGMRGAPGQSRHLTLTLAQPAPAGAWRLLLYTTPQAPRHAAINSALVTPGATTVTLAQGGGGSRCGPPAPMAGLPGVGSELVATWLRADGVVSPPSSPTPTLAR